MNLTLKKALTSAANGIAAGAILTASIVTYTIFNNFENKFVKFGSVIGGAAGIFLVIPFIKQFNDKKLHDYDDNRLAHATDFEFIKEVGYNISFATVGSFLAYQAMSLINKADNSLLNKIFGPAMLALGVATMTSYVIYNKANPQGVSQNQLNCANKKFAELSINLNEVYQPENAPIRRGIVADNVRKVEK